MIRIIEYFGRVQALRSRLIVLPAWARVLLFIAALPGIVLIGLSIFALLVSLSALLLLTVPLYRLLRAVCGVREQPPAGARFGDEASGRKRVEATIVE